MNYKKRCQRIAPPLPSLRPIKYCKSIAAELGLCPAGELVTTDSYDLNVCWILNEMESWKFDYYWQVCKWEEADLSVESW